MMGVVPYPRRHERHLRPCSANDRQMSKVPAATTGLLDPFSCVRNDVKKLRCSTTRNGRFLYEPGR